MTSVTPDPIPPLAAILLAFVNTHDLEQHTDAIATPEALRAWLDEHDLGDGPVDPADVEQAAALREAIRALLLANNGVPEDLTPAREAVEDAGRRGRLSLRFTPDGALSLAPATEGAAAALGRIAASVYALTADGTWPRLKACRAHDCGWAFYDTARNHSRQWCSMQVCGNREKVRAYRRRRSGTAG